MRHGGVVRAITTSPDFDGGTTLVAIRVGTAIASVYYYSTGADHGALAATLTTAMARRLATF